VSPRTGFGLPVIGEQPVVLAFDNRVAAARVRFHCAAVGYDNVVLAAV